MATTLTQKESMIDEMMNKGTIRLNGCLKSINEVEFRQKEIPFLPYAIKIQPRRSQ